MLKETEELTVPIVMTTHLNYRYSCTTKKLSCKVVKNAVLLGYG